MTETILQSLSSLPKQCIYGLINDQDKKIYLGFTTNIVTTLGRLVNDYSNKPYWDKLQFKIIETISDSKNLRVRFDYWTRYYSNNGWKHYRQYKAIGYKVRTDLQKDFRTITNGGYLLYVKLVSRGYKELIVGIFETVSDAEIFIELYYQSIDSVIYSDNDLTSLYLRREHNIYG